MRTLLFIGLFLLLSIGATAQSKAKVDSTGKVVLVPKTVKAKDPDKVIQVIDSVKYYKGPKGGIYYWKKNKKTGQMYKCYLKKD